MKSSIALHQLMRKRQTEVDYDDPLAYPRVLETGGRRIWLRDSDLYDGDPSVYPPFDTIVYTEPTNPFDWLVNLLKGCYLKSACKFDTFEDYLADLCALDYTDYAGAVAVYRRHLVPANEYGNRDWEHL